MKRGDIFFSHFSRGNKKGQGATDFLFHFSGGSMLAAMGLV